MRLSLQRMHRQKGRRQGQAHGLTSPLRQLLLEAAGDRLIDDRNRALLAVAYDAMLRRAELTSLQVTDLLEEMQGHATLLVRRSKTDVEGCGEILYLARDTVRLVRAWLDRGVISEGRLFRSVGKSGRVGERIDPSQVPRIFKAMAREAGLPATVVQGLSGHSARVGAAQDMIAAGIELPAILQAGRWKSTAMVNRYGERLLARRSGTAQLTRLQHRRMTARGNEAIQPTGDGNTPPNRRAERREGTDSPLIASNSQVFDSWRFPPDSRRAGTLPLRLQLRPSQILGFRRSWRGPGVCVGRQDRQIVGLKVRPSRTKIISLSIRILRCFQTPIEVSSSRNPTIANDTS